MPTFLDNSLSGLNRGWQQLYGQQAAGPAVTSLYGAPAAQPIAVQPAPVRVIPVATTPTPVARNPEVGQPMGVDSPQTAQQDSPLTDYFSVLLGLPYIRRMAQSTETPISYNPEMGQTLSGNDSSDGSGAGLLSQGTNPLQTMFQNISRLFGGGGSPSLGSDADLSRLGTNYYQTGGGPTVSDYMAGTASAPAAQDLGTLPSGGGMSGGQMASSAIGAIGSGISNIGKNISSTKATYTAPNIPLPAKAVFTPPTLAPNRNVSF